MRVPSWNGDAVSPRRASELYKTPAALALENEVRQCVGIVLHPPTRDFRCDERRRETRQPFPYPVHLTPLDRAAVPLVEETIVAIGRTISELGVDFYHVKPIPYRSVIASFEIPGGKWVGLLLDLSWCRFGKHGFYDGGGRFLKVMESPLGKKEIVKGAELRVVTQENSDCLDHRLPA